MMASVTRFWHNLLPSLFTVTLFYPFVLADSLLTESYIPEGVSSACASALTADIECSQAVRALQSGEYYPQSRLQAICTDSCSSALSAYHNGILSSCSGDSWEGPGDQAQPLSFISEMIRYHYNLTCIVDNGRFCNNVAAAFAAAANPGTNPAGGDYGSHDTSNPCDTCLIKNFAFQAGSPYYDGPRLQSQSLYESKTASCGITNMPLTTTTNSLFTPTTTSPTADPTCAGQTYAVQAGDDCFSVSLSQGIGTDWLLDDNNLASACHDFPTDGDLCLENTCSVYTVLEADTCRSIAKAHDVTEAQLLAWNPSINAGCYNLESKIGYQICVDKPGTPYVSPSVTPIAPSIPTTAAPVPTNIAAETNDYCGRFYEAKLGDFCNLLTMKFGISLADFIFLNPAINENCTNLYAEESYCVQPVGDLNTYPGKPGATSVIFTVTSGIGDSASTLPDNTWTPPMPTTTPAPVASGTREDCSSYLLGSQWQVDLSGTDFVSACHFVAEVWDVTLEDLETWNPSLGNASDPSCAFSSGNRYCSRYYYGVKEDEDEDVSGSTYPARDNMTADCTFTVDVYETGTPTCETILERFSLTIPQFFEWNPSVGADCSGMWAGYHYCVRVEGFEVITSSSVPTATTTGATTSPSAAVPPAATHSGQPEDCNKWHVVADGDDCSTIEAEYGLSHDQFLAWNTAVSADCLTNFWGGYAYCVGTSASAGAPPTITTSAPTTPTPTGGPVAAPEPNQAGNAVDSCNKYGQAQDGDWCAAFAERSGITNEQLYAWNSVLGATGENCGGSFWATYWYCIGVVA